MIWYRHGVSNPFNSCTRMFFFLGKCACMLFCSARNFLFMGSLNVREFFSLLCTGMLVGYFLLKSPHLAPLKSTVIHPL